MKKCLAVKKSKRKRGKPLKLPTYKDGECKAQFYSLNKLRQHTQLLKKVAQEKDAAQRQKELKKL